jgi:hypothetical protein
MIALQKPPSKAAAAKIGRPTRSALHFWTKLSALQVSLDLMPARLVGRPILAAACFEQASVRGVSQ